MTNSQWQRIFERLQTDIMDRRGIGDEWESIDSGVIRVEISPAWRQIVEEEIASWRINLPG